MLPTKNFLKILQNEYSEAIVLKIFIAHPPTARSTNPNTNYLSDLHLIIYRFDLPIDSYYQLFLYPFRMILFLTAITISYYRDRIVRLTKPLTTTKEQIMPAINKQDNAAIAMAEAVAWLNQNGIRFESLPPYQLKIGPLNFWPVRGTITFDGEDQKRPEKGLDGLVLLLESDRMYRYRHYWQPLTEGEQVSPFRQIEIAGLPQKSTRSF